MSVAAPASAEIPGPRARLTLRYTDTSDGDPDPVLDDFLYVENGITLLNKYFFFDLNTPMVLVLVDGIATAIKFLAGGSDSFLLMSALNPGDREPGWITIFEASGGPQAAQFGMLRVGTGVMFQWSWLFPYFDGTRVNIQPVDLGAVLHLWLDRPGELDVTLALAAGNAWHRYAAFNPFFSVAPVVDIPLDGMLSLHLAGRLQVRQFDFTGYAQNISDPDGFENLVRVKPWLVNWVVEAGPSLRF